jgi:hypothetical protein
MLRNKFLAHMKQIPCRDLIQAHCLRSWLLSHGIEAQVIHEHAADLFAPVVFPVRVAIADADVGRYDELEDEADPPLDDSFDPVQAEGIPEEDLTPANPAPPSFTDFLQFGLVGGIGLGSLGFAIWFLGAPEEAIHILSHRTLKELSRLFAWFLVPGIILGLILALGAYLIAIITSLSRNSRRP